MIYYSQNILLLWNKFRITFSDKLFYIQFNGLVETQKLGVFKIETDQLMRLELMNDLHNDRHSTNQICDFLNQNKIRTIRSNNEYSLKGVWVGLKKYSMRLKRFESDKILRIKEGIYIKKGH